MELSEEELRLLEQMERALVEEDPKLASTLRGTSFQRAARRRMILGGAILVVGMALLVVAVLLELTAVLQTVLGILDQGARLWPHRLGRRRRGPAAPPGPPALRQPVHGAHGGAVAPPPRARPLT